LLPPGAALLTNRLLLLTLPRPLLLEASLLLCRGLLLVGPAAGSGGSSRGFTPVPCRCQADRPPQWKAEVQPLLSRTPFAIWCARRLQQVYRSASPFIRPPENRMPV
jgi:hypothetical protein